MIKRSLIPIFLLVWTLPVTAGPSTPTVHYPQWGNLTPGPFRIGFRVYHLTDTTRAYGTKTDRSAGEAETERLRPIQISLWYPATPPPDAPHLLYAEYAALTATETDFTRVTSADRATALDEFRRSLARNGATLNDTRFARLTATPTAAARDAPPLAGPFPLVILGQGFNNSSLTHSLWCEFLASHGFVVATCPSRGRFTAGMSWSRVDLESQARDLEFIWGQARDWPFVDSDRTALAGFSFGGLAAALVAMRNPHLDALISLDGSEGREHGGMLLSRMPDHDPRALRIPFLYLTTRREEESPPTGLYESLRYAPAWRIILRGIGHGEFTSFAPLLYPILMPGDPLTRSTRVATEATARICLAFLRSCLGKPDDQPVFSPRDIARRYPPGTVTVDSKPALETPPSEIEFIDLIEKHGVSAAESLYHRMRTADPGCLLFNEATLNDIGYRFARAGRYPEAITLLRLVVDSYPDSANAAHSLGDILLRSGQREAAARLFRQTLALLDSDTTLTRSRRADIRRDAEGKLIDLGSPPESRPKGKYALPPH